MLYHIVEVLEKLREENVTKIEFDDLKEIVKDGKGTKMNGIIGRKTGKSSAVNGENLGRIDKNIKRSG